MTSQDTEFRKKIIIQKFPLLITFCFLIIVSYVAFFHHNFWIVDSDGIIYLTAGEQILNGDGKNVLLLNAPIGGPVFYAGINSVFNDGFFTMKLVSVLSATGMVFLSYNIMRNVFDSKIALAGQLLFAFFPWVGLFAIQAENEMFPLFLVMFSLYFITKKHLRIYEIIIIGSLIGIAFMFRAQPIVVLFTAIIYLLIRNSNIRLNLYHVGLILAFFIILSSPVIIYNYTVHENLIDVDSNFYIAGHSKYQTPEWRDEILRSIGKGTLEGISVDFNLFLKNYFYNQFSSIPKNLFGFDNMVNSSLIPFIPGIGLIPVLGGVVYILKIKPYKTNFIILISVSSLTAFIIFLVGDIDTHFFAIVIMPLLVLGIIHFRNANRNFLPLLILPVVFTITLSIIHLRAPEHFLIILISIIAISAIFIMEVIPKIIRIKTKNYDDLFSGNVKVVTIIIISIILVGNLGYSYVTFKIFSSGIPFTNIQDEISFISQNHQIEQFGLHWKPLIDELKKQPGIEQSVIMSSYFYLPYHIQSKSVFANFNEGPENDSVENYILRKNWDDIELMYSNVHSKPIDRHNITNPIPDYIIYTPQKMTIVEHGWQPRDQLEYLKILSEPNNKEIPSNFELIYQSDLPRKVIVYKINHG